jgi:hypothetical protein
MIDPKENRNKYYSQLDKLMYYCGGITCTAEQISLRSMNFGQHWRTAGIKNLNYSVALPKSFVADYIDLAMPEYRSDAEMCPDPNDPFEVQLKRNRWPRATKMLAIPELATLALDYFGYELLLGWFGAGPPTEEPGFILNSVEEFAIDKDLIFFNGKCRHSITGVAFQDV